jgi:hypothetical protein
MRAAIVIGALVFCGCGGATGPAGPAGTNDTNGTNGSGLATVLDCSVMAAVGGQTWYFQCTRSAERVVTGTT